MAKPKEITYAGRVWESSSALARSKGVRLGTFTRRLNAGWSLEQALGDAPPPPRNTTPRTGTPVEWDGTTFPSMNALAKVVGVEASTIAARLKRGWTLSEAVGATRRAPGASSANSIEVRHRGKVYSSRTELAEAFGIKPSILLSRLRSGWSLETALGEAEVPYERGRSKQVTCVGKTYDSVKSLAVDYGVQHGTVYRRLAKGWSPEQAVGLAPSPREQLILDSSQVDLNDCSYDVRSGRVVLPGGTLPLRTFVSARGANYARAQRRLKAGHGLRKALAEDDLRTQSSSTGVKVIVGDKTYPSLAQAARERGVSYNVAKRRVQRGWSVAEALGLEPSPSDKRADSAAAELKTKTRRCARCGVDRQLDTDFAVNAVGTNGRDSVCSACRHAGRRTRIFGLYPHEYLSQLELQRHRCAICQSPDPGGRGWAIDHDHSTGFVRGLLCTACNAGLGHFNDDIGLMAEAINYLQRPTWPELENGVRAAQVSHKLGIRWKARETMACTSCGKVARNPVEAFELFPLLREKRRGSLSAEETFGTICKSCSG